MDNIHASDLYGTEFCIRGKSFSDVIYNLPRLHTGCCLPAGVKSDEYFLDFKSSIDKIDSIGEHCYVMIKDDARDNILDELIYAYLWVSAHILE